MKNPLSPSPATEPPFIETPGTQPSGVASNVQTGPVPFQPRPVKIDRRHPPAPMVGTGVAIYDEQGRVLLARSGKPGRKHPWGLPGGLLDLGERTEDGARREVLEECGIAIEIGGPNGIFEIVDWDEKGDVEFQFIIVEYWAKYTGGALTPGDDIVEVAWVTLDDLLHYNLMSPSIEKIHSGHEAWQKSLLLEP